MEEAPFDDFEDSLLATGDISYKPDQQRFRLNDSDISQTLETSKMSFTEPDSLSQTHSLAKLRGSAIKNKHYSTAAPGDSEMDQMILD